MTHHAHWRDVSPGHFASKHTDTDTDDYYGVIFVGQTTKQ